MPDNIHRCSPEVAAKVAYEMRMFRYAYDKLARLGVDLSDISPGNVMQCIGTGISTEETRDASVLVECFLIHARVLRQFFCGKREGDDGVIADDFVKGWIQPPESDYRYLSEQKSRLNKALAHLTTTRVKYDSEGKYWNLEKIKLEIEPMIEQFFWKLPSDRTVWFKDATSRKEGGSEGNVN